LLRRLTSALALSLAVASPASALAQRAPGRASSGGLEAAPGLAALRVEPRVSYGAPPPSRRAAWARFTHASASPSSWQALWDRDTLAPLRIFGAGIPAPGTVASPHAAEAHARAFLDAHRDLLAPRTTPAELRLVANDLDAGLRTVAFEQLARVDGAGLVPVVGGRVSVRYRSDRLFVLASEIVPPSPLPAPRLDPASAAIAAASWIAEAHAVATLREGPELVALPLVGSGRVELRAAYRVVFDAASPRARWAVYVDAASDTGAPLAREQLLRFDQATIAFDAPVRAPQLGRTTFPARALDLQVDGAALDTDDAGAFSWMSTGMPAAVTVGVAGPLVHVVNQAGAAATSAESASDGQSLLWSLADDEYGDAQLSAFIHGSKIQAHARTIAPTMPFLHGQLQILPSEADPQGCNAFWDGGALNFFRQNGMCNNTARVADVVYHEFGHGFHQNAVIAGAGALDPSLGEAAGDTMAVSYTLDASMAPGFYLNGPMPLRQLDNTAHWPEDISAWDPHETGLIWGGAMWDLRRNLTEELGPGPGNALTDQLYYQALRRSSSIPTTYAEILAADDDDGDLSNGTPHVCSINRAFLEHGLAPMLNEAGLVLAHTPLSVLAPGEGPYPLEVTSKVLYPQCAGAKPVDSISLSFHQLGGGPGTGTLTAQGSSWVGTLPSVPDGTSLRYSIFAGVGGDLTELPSNPADDEYRVFVGDTVPIYCNDFESQIDGWAFSGGKGDKGDFAWGAPAGASGDPDAAFSGQKVLGDRLSGSGAYNAAHTSAATSPVIDVGEEKHVRLQVRRWLTVQDGFYDQATIYANGQQIWQNAGTDSSQGGLDHVDAEWRFEDIDVTPYIAPGTSTVQIRFELVSDKTAQRGGWNLDDFCIVAWHPAPPSSTSSSSGASSSSGGPAPASEGGCACAAPGRRVADEPRTGAALAALMALAAATRRKRAARVALRVQRRRAGPRSRA
jgi:hypothetical protein